MPVDIKYCGLTRADDARVAESLGARYLGFVFAPSPRQVSVEQVEALLHALDTREPNGEDRADAVPRSPRGARPLRVGVFADTDTARIVATVARLSLDVIQLHGVAMSALVRELRSATSVQLWTVVPVDANGPDDAALEAAALGDGLLFDTKVDGRLGGTGERFDWERMRGVVAPLRGARPIILAGGLRPENVARAIAIFAPDVVDVSSGVERAPGIKDPARMRAFAIASHGAAPA